MPQRHGLVLVGLALTIVLSASLGVAYFATAADSLVGYWKFDETTTGTFSDSSGNSNTGTGIGSGGTNTSGPAPSTTVDTGFPYTNARSLDFDGTDDYVTLGDPNSLDLAQFTISAWFYKESGGSTAGMGGFTVYPLVSKGRGVSDGGNLDINYLFGVTTGGLLAGAFEGNGTGTDYTISGTTSIANDTWYHGALTHDGSDFKIYVGGSSENTTSPGVTPVNSS